jgi:hypothetical protein
VNRLKKDFELVTADPGIAQQVGGGGLAGKQQDAAPWVHRVNLNGRLDTAHARHDHVAQKDVGTEVARSFDGFLPAIDGSGLEAILVEDQSEGVGDDAFIVGNQHPGFDPVVRETRIHRKFGKKCIQTLGFVLRVYSRLAGDGLSYFVGRIGLTHWTGETRKGLRPQLPS